MQLKLLLNCCEFTFFVGLELCNICLYIQVECSFWVTFLFSKKVFFSIRVFFHGHWQLTGQQGKGGDHLLFHSTNSTRSRTFRHLFATLHVRWLSHIFNRNACIYQTATWWDLPHAQIIIWFIYGCHISFCVLVEMILGFLTSIWHEKPVDSNSIDYYPYITSGTTNQVC